jgi:tetratricopeptide (TPR) repeat protein
LRRKVLQAGLQAAAAFAAAGKSIPQLPHPGEDAWFDQRLAANQWADPLLLLMAAVIAKSEGLNTALKLSRPDLAKTLAARERDRIRNSVQTPVAKDLLAHLYACVTLCGGLSRNQSNDVAEKEFERQHKQYPGGPGQAVEGLARVLGAHDPLPPLIPDLIGEALLPLTFNTTGAQVTTCLSTVSPAGVASSLIRSAQDFGPSGETWPLEWLKSLIAQGQSDLAILREIESALPQQTLVLRRLAVEVTKSLVDKLSQQSQSAPQDVESYLAGLWNNLSARQSDMGQRGEALASITEAVRIYRALAETNPDALLPDLGNSLNNQAAMQSDMGQRGEALASIAEAVRIRRALAETNPDAFLPNLAGSFNNQAAMQSAMGQRGEALASIAEAVRIYRALAETNPDAFLPNLANSLNNQANRQSAMGQRGEALASTAEAVRISRALAETNPDAFLPDLASSLSVLGDCLDGTDQLPEAFDAAAESLRALSPFVSRHPGVFDGLAKATTRDYVMRSQRLGLDPDFELLNPYLRLFESGEANE